MIEWCNANQGFALVLLTLCYSIATGIIALIYHRSYNLSRDNLNLATELEKRRSRPYISFNIVQKDFLIEAVLRNDGLTPAKDVTITLDPKLTRSDGSVELETPLTRNKIKQIFPRSEFSDTIDSGPEFFKKYPTACFKGTISYADLEGSRYNESLDIDLGFVKDLGYVSEESISSQLGKIAKNIETISRGMTK